MLNVINFIYDYGNAFFVSFNPFWVMNTLLILLSNLQFFRFKSPLRYIVDIRRVKEVLSLSVIKAKSFCAIPFRKLRTRKSIIWCLLKAIPACANSSAKWKSKDFIALPSHGNKSFSNFGKKSSLFILNFECKLC